MCKYFLAKNTNATFRRQKQAGKRQKSYFFVLKFAYSKFLLYLCSVKRFNVLKMHAAVVESVDTKDFEKDQRRV